MWGPVTELLVIDTLVPTEAGHLARSTEGSTLLLVTAIKTVCFSIAMPGLGHTLPTGGTAELVGPTSCRERIIYLQGG